MAKSIVNKKPAETIRVRHDTQAGLDCVDVFVGGEWREVSSQCTLSEAEDVAVVLSQWKRKE